MLRYCIYLCVFALFFSIYHIDYVYTTESIKETVENHILRNWSQSTTLRQRKNVFNTIFKKSNTWFLIVPIVLAIFYTILQCAKSLKSSRNRRLSDDTRNVCEKTPLLGGDGRSEEEGNSNRHAAEENVAFNRKLRIILTALIAIGMVLSLGLISLWSAVEGQETAKIISTIIGTICGAVLALILVAEFFVLPWLERRLQRREERENVIRNLQMASRPILEAELIDEGDKKPLIHLSDSEDD